MSERVLELPVVRRDGATLEPLVCVTGAFEVALINARGPTKEVCEDAVGLFQIGEGAIVTSVVDGMGGMRNGRDAARITVESVGAECAAFVSGASRRGAIVEGLERAHARTKNECPGGGATAVCALATREWVQPVHAGDAEAFLVGQRGRVKLRTLADSPVGYAQEAGLLTEEDALRHPERHVVSNGIGIEGMSIHVGPRLALGRRDTLLLVSDGVTDNAREAEIVASIRSGPLSRGVSALVTLCRDRMLGVVDGSARPAAIGKPDDLSVLALRRRS